MSISASLYNAILIGQVRIKGYNAAGQFVAGQEHLKAIDLSHEANGFPKDGPIKEFAPSPGAPAPGNVDPISYFFLFTDASVSYATVEWTLSSASGDEFFSSRIMTYGEFSYQRPAANFYDEFTYNEFGEVASSTFVNEGRTDYVYDKLGRLRATKMANGNAQIGYWTLLSYDRFNRLIAESVLYDNLTKSSLQTKIDNSELNVDMEQETLSFYDDFESAYTWESTVHYNNTVAVAHEIIQDPENSQNKVLALRNNTGSTIARKWFDVKEKTTYQVKFRVRYQPQAYSYNGIFYGFGSKGDTWCGTQYVKSANTSILNKWQYVNAIIQTPADSADVGANMVFGGRMMFVPRIHSSSVTNSEVLFDDISITEIPNTNVSELASNTIKIKSLHYYDDYESHANASAEEIINASGQVTRELSFHADGSYTEETYFYNEHGNVTKKWVKLPNLDRKEIVYSYNKDDQRLEKLNYQPEDASERQLLYYDYNSLGQLKTVSSNGVDTKSSAKIEARYSYDDYGRDKSIYYNNAASPQLTYSYDYLGRLIKINDIANLSGKKFAEELSYTADGLIQSTRLYNGAFTGSAASDAKFIRYSYSYNDFNELIKAQFQYSGSSSNFSTPTSLGAFGTEYSYDLNGNIKTLLRNKNGSSDDWSYHYAAGTDRLDRISGSKSYNFNYDQAGLLQADPIQNRSLSYNYRHNLAHVKEGSVTKESYDYDGQTRRVRKRNFVSGTNTTSYIYGLSADPIAIYENGVIREWSLGGFGNKQNINGIRKSFYHLKDHKGSVRVTLADESLHFLEHFENGDSWGHSKHANNTDDPYYSLVKENGNTVAKLSTSMNSAYYNKIFDVKANKTYKIKARFKVLNSGLSHGGFAHLWYRTDGSSYGWSWHNVDLSKIGQWQELEFTMTAASDVNRLRLYPGLNSYSAGSKAMLFDDIQVIELSDGSVNETSIASAQDYYPFGKSFRSFTSSNGKHVYSYSSKEQDEYTDYSSYGFRYYNADLARWMNPDPAHQFASPYVFNGNVPHIGQDKDGRWFFLIPILAEAIGASVATVAAISTVTTTVSYAVAAYNIADVAVNGGNWMSALVATGASFAIGAASDGLGLSGDWLTSTVRGAATGLISDAASQVIMTGDATLKNVSWGNVAAGAVGGFVGSENFQNLLDGNGFHTTEGYLGIEADNLNLKDDIGAGDATDENLNAKAKKWFKRDEESDPSIKTLRVANKNNLSGTDYYVDKKGTIVDFLTKKRVGGITSPQVDNLGRPIKGAATVRMAPNSFRSQKKLYMRLGHEFIHVDDIYSGRYTNWFNNNFKKTNNLRSAYKYAGYQTETNAYYWNASRATQLGWKKWADWSWDKYLHYSGGQ